MFPFQRQDGITIFHGATDYYRAAVFHPGMALQLHLLFFKHPDAQSRRKPQALKKHMGGQGLGETSSLGHKAASPGHRQADKRWGVIVLALGQPGFLAESRQQPRTAADRSQPEQKVCGTKPKPGP